MRHMLVLLCLAALLCLTSCDRQQAAAQAAEYAHAAAEVLAEAERYAADLARHRDLLADLAERSGSQSAQDAVDRATAALTEAQARLPGLRQTADRAAAAAQAAADAAATGSGWLGMAISAVLALCGGGAAAAPALRKGWAAQQLCRAVVRGIDRYADDPHSASQVPVLHERLRSTMTEADKTLVRAYRAGTQ